MPLIRKQILLLCVTFTAIVKCSSQDHILSTNDNIVYKNVENLISINLSHKTCKTVIFKTDNGKVEKEGCYLKYTPSRLGIAKIEIFKIRQGKKEKIGESEFRTRPLRDPSAYFAGLDGGNIPLERAKANQGLMCLIPDLVCSPTISVDKYSIILIKKSGSFLTTENIGARFDSVASDLMKKLDRGDRLIFSKIITHTPDNVQRPAKPIEFTID